MAVPMAFRVLPEYILEDIVDYLYFVVQQVAESPRLQCFRLIFSPQVVA